MAEATDMVGSQGSAGQGLNNTVLYPVVLPDD